MIFRRILTLAFLCASLIQVSAHAYTPGPSAKSVTTVAGTSGVTLTAAQLVNGIIQRTGPTSAFTDTTDTAANIIAAIPFASPGSSVPILIQNGAGGTMTLAGGAGVTVPTGFSTITAGTTEAATILVNSGGTTVTIYLQGPAGAGGVASINSLTGALTLAGSNGFTTTAAGTTITVSGTECVANIGAVINAAYTVSPSTDLGCNVRIHGSANLTITLPSPSSSGFGAGKALNFINEATTAQGYTVTVSYAGGSADPNGNTSVTIPSQSSCGLASDQISSTIWYYTYCPALAAGGIVANSPFTGTGTASSPLALGASSIANNYLAPMGPSCVKGNPTNATAQPSDVCTTTGYYSLTMNASGTAFSWSNINLASNGVGGTLPYYRGGTSSTTLFAGSPSGFSSAPGTGAAFNNINTSFSFTFTVGSGGTASSAVINMNSTAAHYWVCPALTDITSTGIVTRQIAPTSTTQVTIESFNTGGTITPWNASDVVTGLCSPE